MKKKSPKVKWKTLPSYRDVKVYEDNVVDRDEKYRQKEKKETIILSTMLSEFSRTHCKYEAMDHWLLI